MPGMGGGGGTVQTTSKQDVNMGPWQAQEPYLKDAFNSASFNFHNPSPNYYPNSTVSPFTAAQNTGYNSIIDKAGNNPLFPAAQDTYLKTVNGSYLDPNSNPHLRGTFDAASQAVSDQYKNITAPTTDALFASNGPISGGARQNAINLNNANLGRTLDNLATSIYGGNYQAERGRQDAATNNVGAMTQASYLDPTAMVNAGGAQQAQNQKELTDEVNRWMSENSEDARYKRLMQYMSVVGGNNWGQNGTTTTTSQQPYSSNPMMQAFGGLLSLGSMAGQMGWNPFGGSTAAIGELAR